MDTEFDLSFLEVEGLDEADLYVALQLQRQLDLVFHGLESSDDEGDVLDQINRHFFDDPSPRQPPTEDEDEDDDDDDDDGDDDEDDADDTPSPQPSLNSLEFSPGDWTAGLGHTPLPNASSSEESLLHSPDLPFASSSRWAPRPTFSCSICLDDHPEDDIALIPTCEHSFCRDCLRSYITTKVSEHRFPVFCPVCITITDEVNPGVITEEVIEDIWIPEKEFRIFEDMQLSSLSILLHCRQCKETMYVARDEYEQNKIITCPLPTCTYQWCTACQKNIPPGDPTHNCDADTGFADMVRENGWKFCPGCKAPIQKESGCNHMTCITPGCNVNFCYSCGDTIVRSALVKEINDATMSHYREKCRLFEDIPDVDVPP